MFRKKERNWRGGVRKIHKLNIGKEGKIGTIATRKAIGYENEEKEEKEK